MFFIRFLFFRKSKTLTFIARVGSEIEHIDQKFIKNKNIILINSSEGNRNSLAEHTLTLRILLILLHNIKNSDNEIRKGYWNRNKNRGDELIK